MAAPQASSRLELLQARFQQKQLQEKEQKLLQLYDQQQQRAYQVVQRGSAGSNSSNHTISQHTVTKTSSSTTSTSQCGKVRQMFDERRQTNVKGIDRSYPLEPLENKPRRQANGNGDGVQKNGNLTVSRQSVTVKRVARADVNSNLNGGKPVVSYHEEITRESFGPSIRQHQDDDEFGNENHVVRYANGNHRDGVHIEEVTDEDSIERNRMMAKLHLMEYDQTLKHRVKNDLESEEFPEDLMLDVPDKLLKQNVTKKLSQAEARLERFKNANAKYRNNVTKNPMTTSKKRTDPIYPAKSTPSVDRAIKTKTTEELNRKMSSRKESLQTKKSEVIVFTGNVKNALDFEKILERELTAESFKDGTRRSESPKFVCKESDKSATTSAIDSKPSKRFSSEEITRRHDNPKFFCKESEKSGTTYAIGSKTAKRFSPELSRNIRRSESPKFFCKESEKSATTFAIDSKTTKGFSSESCKDTIRRSESPKYFCKESDKSATTYAIDSKTAKVFSPELSKERIQRSVTPKFFCKESEKSATTYAIDSKTRPTMPDYMKDTESFLSKVESKYKKDVPKKVSIGFDTVDRHIKFSKHKPMSKFPSLDDLKYDKSPAFQRLRRERSSSPQFFLHEPKTSSIKETKFTSKWPYFNAKDIKQRYESPTISSQIHSTSTIHVAKSESPDFMKGLFRKSNTSPQLYVSDSDRSATSMTIRPETIMKPKTEFADSKKRREDIESPVSSFAKTMSEPKRKTFEEIDNENLKQSSTSQFFTERDAGNNVPLSERDKTFHLSRDSSPLSLKDMRTPSPTGPQFCSRVTEKRDRSIDRSRSSSLRSQRVVETPKFYQTKKLATTVSLKPKGTTDSKRSIGQKVARKTLAKPTSLKNRSSKSPDNSARILDRRDSGNVLRSIKLIRDAMRRENVRNQGDYALESRISPTHGISKLRSRVYPREKEIWMSKKVETAGELSESNPRSSSTEVDMEIQEITMPDQYVKQEWLHGTFSKSKTEDRKSRAPKLFTYSVPKPIKKRGSLFETNVFELKGRDNRGTKRRTVEDTITRKGETKVLKFSRQTPIRIKKVVKSPVGKHSLKSPTTSKSIVYERKAGENIDRRNELKISSSREQSPTQRKLKTPSPEIGILKSMQLLRQVMDESNFDKVGDMKTKSSILSKTEIKESVRERTLSSKNYERTDSVESALRRFDSIGTETDSIKNIKGSIAAETDKIECSIDSKKFSLKTLDRPLVSKEKYLSRSPETKSLRTSRKHGVKKTETQGQKKFAKAKDSMEIARIVMRSKSPACKRKLFQGDSEEEIETISFKSRQSPRSSKREIGARRSEFARDKKTNEKCTDTDSSVSVKQLRSIEDIRKSIKGEASKKSAVASNASRRSERYRINTNDCGGKGISLPRRSGNVATRNDILGNRSSVKCAMRFSRFAKSPSPEAIKETSSRPKTNIPTSPSKSPDIVSRRPSTELKAQDTKSTKRPTPMKGTEPIGNRKTMTTTSASTRKSTDVVDGAILENGLHLRDQTAETKYDNGPSTTRKTDAFVIDFDEQPSPKENDASFPRKPLSRKQSIEKQIQSVRPPSSVSYTSNGSSMQGRTIGSRGKMATRAKIPTSGSIKGSSSNKSGGSPAAADNLVSCKICGRRFAQDRIALHEQICAKTGQKKRKQFDATAFRVRGTDIEPFYKRGLLKKPLERSKKPEVKSNWRRKHEDFINTIRSAKQVQAHLAAGGKLSDLPPPPVSDNCDYVQCPHCGRKFNQAAAERHIPKCENMLHNKPTHSRAPKPRR